MLTRVFDDASERGHAITPRGMAFWADTGPFGVTCRDCRFYHKGHCRRYQQLTGRPGKNFRADTRSCKYFERPE